MEAGADVEVVSPILGPDLSAEQATAAGWRWTPRPFRDPDVEGRLLVIAATDDAQANGAVAAAARARGVLVNVVDDPEESDFHVPSVVRRGPLQLTVTTGGLAPAVSARVRRRLEALFSEQWGEALELLGQARRDARAAGYDEHSRRALARALADLDIEALLADGGVARVKEAVQSCTSQYSA